MTKPLKLRWVLAHIPYDLFLRSANAFSQAIKEKSNGTIEVEILGKDEWEKKYLGGKEVSYAELVRMVEKGLVEMTQTYSTVLGHFNKDFYALDMPFLFSDHDHATRVLDGEIGKSILTNLEKTSQMRGLAFTYSGGYKMIAANKDITSIADIKGMALRCGGSPVSEATFAAVGATTEALGVDGMLDALKSKTVEGGENVFPRYFRSKVNEQTNTVADTQHAMFLTSIVISTKVWDKLTPDQQQLIKESAEAAAVTERNESLIDGAANKARCPAEGIKLIEWSSEAVAEFKQATETVYDEFREYFSTVDLARKIREA